MRMSFTKKKPPASPPTPVVDLEAPPPQMEGVSPGASPWVALDDGHDADASSAPAPAPHDVRIVAWGPDPDPMIVKRVPPRAKIKVKRAFFDGFLLLCAS